MPKTDPNLVGGVAVCLDLVDQAGQMASKLIRAGLTADHIKKLVRQRFGVSLGTAGANLITAMVLKVWGG